MEGYHAMGAFVSGDACDQSRIYSGTAKSVKPSSSQGYYEGIDKYRTRWGYAISLESKKVKYEQPLRK